MNIFQLFILLAILLKCVIASESGVAPDVIQALSENEKENGFVSIKEGWEGWRDRTDLFDCVVTKGVEFIVGFINQVLDAKRRTLAALFINRSDIVDQVLERINCYDNDLIGLTYYRSELAESHEGFFMVIDKIKKSTEQERTVGNAVRDLFDAEKYASVILLINALEKRQFNGRKLNDVAIQWAFYEGAWRGIKGIVEKFHEHPAITSKEYADGLSVSWEKDNLNITFPFLLTQADQGDLEEARRLRRYDENQTFRDDIDGAFSEAEPAGSRYRRFLVREMVRLVKEAFDEAAGLESLGKGKEVGGIILDYLGGSEGTEGGKGQ